MLLNVKKSSIPSSEKKGLKSSSLVLSSFSDDLCKGSLCELVNNQAENQLPECANVVSLIPDSEDVCFSIGSNPSGISSCKKFKSKETQDLKSLLTQNVACDSLSIQDSIPLVSSNVSDGNSNANFYSPPYISSALGKLALANEVSHTADRKNELLENLSSLAQSRKQESPSSQMAALPVLRSGSTSLADLLQEHQEKSSASHCYSLADLYTQSTASLTDRSLGASSLSQLVSQPQTSGGMPELTGSLSSLALSTVSPLKEVENLSLSDLIAEAIEVDNAQEKNDVSMLSVIEPSKRTNIDLSVLLKNADASAEQNIVGQSNILIPETKHIKVKQGKSSGFAKTNKKIKRGLASKRQDLSLSWVKALCARPSAFALTLCLRYPPKGYKRHTTGMHKAFLYSRQVQDVKPKEIAPVTAITPFDFKSASPDDIVKAKQRKAFTRQ